MRKHLVISLTTLLLISNIFAQRTDSLITLLDNSEAADQIHILHDISKSYINKDTHKAFEYVEKAISLANEIDDENALLESMIVKSEIYFSTKNYDKAIDLCYKNIASIEDGKKDRYKSQLYFLVAKILDEVENYKIATYCINKSMRLDSIYNEYTHHNEKITRACKYAIQLNNTTLVDKYESSIVKDLLLSDTSNIDFINTLIQISSYKKRYDLVCNYFAKLKTIAKAKGDTAFLISTLNRDAQIKTQIYNFDEALALYNEAAAIATPDNALDRYCTIRDSIASIYSKKLQYDEALDILYKNIEIRKQKKKQANTTDHLLLAKIYTNTKQYAKAKELLLFFIDNSTKTEKRIQAITQVLNLPIKIDEQNRLKVLKSELIAQSNELKYRNALLSSELGAKVVLNEKMLSDTEITHTDAKTNYYILSLVILIFLVIVYLVLRGKTKLQKSTNEIVEAKNKEISNLKNKLEENQNALNRNVKERTKELQEELSSQRSNDLDLKKALKKAEEANYLKNAFLSNMSHEIRTPLNGILGFASMLKTELSLMENQELYEYANSINESGDRLLHLLNNLIDISRIEANDMTISLTPCNLNKIINDISKLYHFKANEKGLQYNVKLQEDLPEVMLEKNNMSRICSDIIDNALKYTESGFINIVSGYDEKEEEVYIKVKDTGIGIDESYIPKVFEAFRQESLGYSRAYQGAGLGLPLAKRMIELMNGRITIESKKAVGTLVSIFFPTKEQQFKNIPKTANVDSKEEVIIVSSNETILNSSVYAFIVEDDRMNRLVISKMINKKCKYEMAEDGNKTMEMIDSFYEKGIIFDIMLFDINLPSPWDGIKLMHAIRKKYREYKRIPFIAQTAYAMTGDKERLLDAGFDDYIPKPINENILINSMKNQLKS